MSHHPSSQARTPRSAQESAYARSESYTLRGMAPNELLMRYVERSRIGNSPRHFSRSSMITHSNDSTAGLPPSKIAQGNEKQPWQPGGERDAKSRHPPSRNEHSAESEGTKQRSPVAARTEARRRPWQPQDSPAKCQVGDENHQPHKNAAEKSGPEHVHVSCRAIAALQK